MTSVAMLRLALIDGTPEQRAAAQQAAARLRDVKFIPHAALEDVDGVWLAGPVSSRTELACRAAQAGKHLLIESPMADSPAGADEILSSCETASVKLMVGSSLRYRPSIAVVKSALDSGKLGHPALLRAHAWQPAITQSSADLNQVIVQHLDLAAWIFAGLPTEIFSLARASAADRSRWPDYVQLHLGFPNGGMALITLSQKMPAGDNYESYSVVGSTGAAYADDHYQTHLVYRGDAPRAVKSDETLMTLTAQLWEFVAAITTNREPSATGADGKTALVLAAAARQSLLAGQPVHLQDGQYVIR